MKNNTSGRNDVSGNAAQMEAIHHGNGPAMVLAGPGSGKTFVIVQRLSYMIEELLVDPSQILVITFTKAAAIEMQQRFLKITDSSYPEVSFGTFHSVFYQIIRQSKSKSESNIQIASESFKFNIVNDILLGIRQRNSLDEKNFEISEEVIKDILEQIGKLKNTLQGLDSLNENVPFGQFFEEIFTRYNDSLSEFGKIDFDDMLGRCLKLLSENPSVLSKWRVKFKYILVDEYQDINPVQSRIIELLLGEDKNLFVVGDDDQAIYSFRGSSPEIMLSFNDMFKGYNPRNIELNINYRCGSSILDTALLVINENRNRFKKSLRANESNGKGFVVPKRYESREIQALDIVRFCKNNMHQIDKIAIIFRTNAEAHHMAMYLKDAGIPNNLDEKEKGVLERESVKLLINYLKFACGEKSREIFLKIMNKPMRYISRECLTSKDILESDLCFFYQGNFKKINVIKKLFRQINMISHMRPSLSVRFLRRDVGIDSMYPKDIKALDEFSSFAAGFDDNRALLEALSDMSDIGDKKESKASKGKELKLITMHASKGLEYECVWIPNLNEGIIPQRSAVNGNEIEEERRMLYVAMTRAKKELILSYIKGNKENPMLPSRFLRPIRYLWEDHSSISDTSPSSPSSGTSTSSSNSTSSRYSSNASETAIYSSSSEM